MRNGHFEPSINNVVDAKIYTGTVLTFLRYEESRGNPWGSFPNSKNFYNLIINWKIGFDYCKSKIDLEVKKLDELITALDTYIKDPKRNGQYPNYTSNPKEIAEISSLVAEVYKNLGGSNSELLPLNEDIPIPFKGLLKELPSLPSQKAILVGWATELPILFKVRDLNKNLQPQSEDPDFWDVWTRKDINGNTVERTTNWKEIADDWQEKKNL